MWLSRTIFIALREKIASFCVANISIFVRELYKMLLSKQSDFWHADSSNMIFEHVVKHCGYM